MCVLILPYVINWQWSSLTLTMQLPQLSMVYQVCAGKLWCGRAPELAWQIQWGHYRRPPCHDSNPLGYHDHYCWLWHLHQRLFFPHRLGSSPRSGGGWHPAPCCWPPGWANWVSTCSVRKQQTWILYPLVIERRANIVKLVWMRIVATTPQIRNSFSHWYTRPLLSSSSLFSDVKVLCCSACLQKFLIQETLHKFFHYAPVVQQSSNHCGACRCADYVLLNKTDMLVKGELESLIEIVHTLNPLAQVTTSACSVIRDCWFLCAEMPFWFYQSVGACSGVRTDFHAFLIPMLQISSLYSVSCDSPFQASCDSDFLGNNAKPSHVKF